MKNTINQYCTALKFTTIQHSSNILERDIGSIELLKTYCIEKHNFITKIT